ncbi:dTDP-glucose 4,6-dehydratase [Brevibacillus laterosporus]|uniref:dTDP-glucose 4,6-dehydratase n=1 Tax=Brevibacillus laterosporus TaxID=1465 RepID=UPI0026539C43|nr:dTDP-glucose 4,6-dehydratase [Brevibacillus laterosporus]MDN9012185.1 dTDP-glucose 4,6-dehydratase [Brevibacillus laterosporus]MDO0943281.1 dTDP-glucose 4,6-dehydratase [Brevibacillus laterosporus]
MKVLVTGGAGFIGSNFIHYLLHQYPHYKIINLDYLTYAGNLENLQDIEEHPHYRFVRGSIYDKKLIGKLLSGEKELFSDDETPIDIIINFAAESHVDRSISDPSYFVKTNITGTQVLLEFAKRYKIKQFLQVSTDEVYGSLDETGLFTEDSPLAPNSPYSASKAAADLLVRSYHQTYDMYTNITRCSNNYGPYQFPEKLIPLAITNAIAYENIPVYGDGLHVRDWLHVEDHCRAIDLVMHSGKPGEVYNIGGNNEWTNLSLLQTLLRELDREENLLQFSKDRPKHDRRYAIDSTKIRTELGWEPIHAFEEGLANTIRWYQQNEQWWKRAKSGAFREYYKQQYGHTIQDHTH